MSATDGLTPDQLADLRRPFTRAAIQWRVLTKAFGDPPKAMCIYYIDARLVAERLNAVLGPHNWSDSYRPLFENDARAHMAAYFPVECQLTVYGVTKTDVGVYQRDTCDDIAMKGAYSDAFKRAGVKFGIGAYLASIPRVAALVEVQDGKAKGLTKAGDEFMGKAYEKWLGLPINRFGEPFDHGDVLHEEVSV